MVLEPDLHLGRCQPDQTGQVLALRSRQVPLLPEPPLQLVRLGFGEQDPSLTFLVDEGVVRLVFVGFVVDVGVLVVWVVVVVVLVVVAGVSGGGGGGDAHV